MVVRFQWIYRLWAQHEPPVVGIVSLFMLSLSLSGPEDSKKLINRFFKIHTRARVDYLKLFWTIAISINQHNNNSKLLFLKVWMFIFLNLRSRNLKIVGCVANDNNAMNILTFERWKSVKRYQCLKGSDAFKPI